MEIPEQSPFVSVEPNQPVISPVPLPPPKKRSWWKWVLLLVAVVAIVLAVFVYIYRYEVFESSWRHSINNLEEKYNADAVVFDKQFKTVNNVNFLTTASSGAIINVEYVAKVDVSMKLFDDVSADIDEMLRHTGAEAGTLSEEDASVRDLYRACYEGRNKGATLSSEALQNTSKYVQAYTLQQNYGTYDFKKFQNSFSALGVNMRAKNMATIPAGIVAARADILVAKADIDGTFALLGYDSYKQESVAYQLLLDGLDDIESSIPKKDAALVYKGATKWQQAGDLFKAHKDQTVIDLKDWLDNQVTAKYQNGNAEIVKVNDVCTKAESASKLSKENTPVNIFMKRLRGL